MKHADLNIIDLIKIWSENKKTVILITIILTIISVYAINRNILSSKNIYAEFFLINSSYDRINLLTKFSNNEKKKILSSQDDQKNFDNTLLTSEIVLWDFYEVLRKKLISNKIQLFITPQIIKNENNKNLSSLKVYITLKKIDYTAENLEKLKKEIIEIEKIIQLQFIENINNLQNEYIKYSNANIIREIRKLEFLINEKKNWKVTNEQYFMENKNNVNIYNLRERTTEDYIASFLSVTALENRIRYLEQTINKSDLFILSEFEENKKYFQNNKIVTYDINIFKDSPPSYKEGTFFHVFIFIISFCFSLILTLLIQLYKKKSLK
jgi:hypothetical protein